jgi:hypothetical protein
MIKINIIMMKTLIVFLFVIGMVTNATAQTNSPDIKTGILNLLESKHDYERRLSLRDERRVLPYKTKYIESFARIKENKSQVLLYINNALKADTTDLSKEFVYYEWENPFSSVNDVKNRISLLTYFKIVRSSLEGSKDMLPLLREVSLK